MIRYLVLDTMNHQYSFKIKSDEDDWFLVYTNNENVFRLLRQRNMFGWRRTARVYDEVASPVRRIIEQGGELDLTDLLYGVRVYFSLLEGDQALNVHTSPVYQAFLLTGSPLLSAEFRR